jgi:ferrous iron transport protein A
MYLNEAEVGEYVIESVELLDTEMLEFLFRLGCYDGQKISLVNKKRKIFTVVIKDARYCIDNRLAMSIKVKKALEDKK